MKVAPNFFTPDQQYRYSYGQTSKPLFTGNFAHKESKGDYGLWELDEYDKNLIKDIPLKPGEFIYRAYTEKSMVCGLSFLVKINFNNGMVYFNDIEATELGVIKFERKGCQLQYINLLWASHTAVFINRNSPAVQY